MTDSEKSEKGSEFEMMNSLPELVKIDIEAFPREKREILKRFQKFLNSGLNRIKNGRTIFLGNFFNLDTEKGTCGLTAFDNVEKGINTSEFLAVLIELFTCLRDNFMGTQDVLDKLIVKALAISKFYTHDIEANY